MAGASVEMALLADFATPSPDPTAASAAYNAVLDRILTRELTPGTVLHEVRLAETLGVSRTPLREALRRLEGEGLVGRNGGRSLVVQSITVREYIEALHVRRLLESEAAFLAAERIDRDLVAGLRARISAMMQSGEPTPSDHWTLDDDVHGALARASGNDLLAAIVQALRRKTRLFNLKRMPNRFLPGCREHLTILDALDRRDGARARAAMAAHLDNVKASILDKLAEI